MEIGKIVYLHGSPYKTVEEIARDMKICQRSVNTRLKEIREEILNKRYPDSSVIKDGKFVFINYLVYIDYITYRQRLQEKNLRKRVPPFNANALASSLGWYAEVAL